MNERLSYTHTRVCVNDGQFKKREPFVCKVHLCISVRVYSTQVCICETLMCTVHTLASVGF